MPKAPTDLRSFQSFVEVIEALRGPDGCPWDLKQTNKSLTPYAIEEAHELAEAIEKENWEETCDELGDLLLQVVLHAEVAKQAGHFDINDVIESIGKKMVRRHPHVFSDSKARSDEEISKNWQEIKAQEKKEKRNSASLPDRPKFDIPISLPALQRASKIGGKTKKYGFDWPDIDGVLAKVEEELTELKDEIYSTKNLGEAEPGQGETSATNTSKHQRRTRIESELGDLLFSVAQVGRHLKLDSEQCLRLANQKFENRFWKMKVLAENDGKDFERLSSVELEEYWVRVKNLKA